MTPARPPVLRAVRDGAVVAGLLFTLYLFVVVAPSAGTVGFDAFAYWNVNPADPYETGVGGLGAFNYSPPIAWLIAPFGALQWPTFLWLPAILWWAIPLGIIAGVVVYHRPSIWVWPLLAFCTSYGPPNWRGR